MAYSSYIKDDMQQLIKSSILLGVVAGGSLQKQHVQTIQDYLPFYFW